MANTSFTIEKPSRDSNNYTVYEWNNGEQTPIFTWSGENSYGGLKESRQAIGKYLQETGCILNSVFDHRCIIHDRDYNPPPFEWTVEEYLIGVPTK